MQTLSAKFTAEFGRGFSHRNLGSIVRFAEIFPNAKALILLEDLLKGEFGIEVGPSQKLNDTHITCLIRKYFDP